MGIYFLIAQVVFGLFALIAIAGIIFLLRAKAKKAWHWVLAGFLGLLMIGNIGAIIGAGLIKNISGINKEGTPSQNFAYTSLPDDLQKKLHDNKGKVIVLNFWATWCGPCIEEMPALDKLQKEFGDQGVVVLAVSDEEKDIVMPYVEENKFDISFGSSPEAQYFKEIAARPTTFIIDREGTIREVIIGGRGFESFAGAIRKLL